MQRRRGNGGHYGADLLTGWSKESDGSYSIPWKHRLYQGDDHNPGGAEQVFLGGTLLRKVSSLHELTEETFFVDHQRKRLHLRTTRNPDETRKAADRGFNAAGDLECQRILRADSRPAVPLRRQPRPAAHGPIPRRSRPGGGLHLRLVQ